MDNTLRKALWGFLRPLVQLITNLLSPEVGEEWEKELKRFLRKEACWVKKEYELYLHPEQKSGSILGFGLEKYLKEKGLIKRAFSLESPLVKLWRENPETYPEELKDKAVFLWGSRRTADGNRQVACLFWFDGRVSVGWVWLEDWWARRCPAVLASSS